MCLSGGFLESSAFLRTGQIFLLKTLVFPHFSDTHKLRCPALQQDCKTLWLPLWSNSLLSDCQTYHHRARLGERFRYTARIYMYLGIPELARISRSLLLFQINLEITENRTCIRIMTDSMRICCSTRFIVFFKYPVQRNHLASDDYGLMEARVNWKKCLINFFRLIELYSRDVFDSK